MANIKEYDSNATLKPSAQPAGYAAQTAMGDLRTQQEIGQVIGGAVAGAGRVADNAYNKFVVQPEVAKGGAVGTGLVNSLTQSWNDLAKNADPADGSIAKNFTEKTLEPALAKFIDSFQTPAGKEWAIKQAQNYRDHFQSMLLADTTSRAASAAVITHNETTNNLSNLAAADPTSLDFALAQSAELWKNTKANLGLDGAKAAALDVAHQAADKELVGAALKSLADRNPTQFIKDLASGKFSQYDKYLGADDKLTIRKYAEAAEKTKAVDASAADAARVRAEKAAVDKATNDIYANYFIVGDDNSVHIKDGFAGAALQIGAMPGATETTVTSIIAAGRAITNDERARVNRTSDPDVFHDFSARAYLNDNDPNKLKIQEIYQARGANQISNADFAFFNSAVTKKDPVVAEDRKVFDQWYGGMKGFIDKSNLFSQDSPEAKERAAQFARDKWSEYEAARAAGVDRQKALVGLEKNLAAYQVSSGSSITSLTNRAAGTPPSPLPAVNSGNVPARLPNETPQQYLLRTAPGAAKPAPAPAPAPAPKPAATPAPAVTSTAPTPPGDPAQATLGSIATENAIYKSFLDKDGGLTDAEKTGMMRAYSSAPPDDRRNLMELLAKKQTDMRAKGTY